jgi:hypothetical protein
MLLFPLRLSTWLVAPPPPLKNKRNQVAFLPPMMDPVQKFAAAEAFNTDGVAGAAIGFSRASDGLIVGGFGAGSAAPVFGVLTQALGNKLDFQSQPLSPARQWMIDVLPEDGDVDDYDDPPPSLPPP